MLKQFVVSLFVISNFSAFAQEGLKPLGTNINYLYRTLQPAVSVKPETHETQKTQTTSLFLPFIEDFHYASSSNYPDQNKWMDSDVYINCGYAIAPPSIGVATFDGLNDRGYPYNDTQVNLNVTSGADSLTSRPINMYLSAISQTLSPFSDVALSFYYQARGRGDSPEIADSLILDFYKPLEKTWQTVWFSPGNNNSNINDSAFKRGFVRIKDTAYFHDNFQFRFRNWASRAGNFDNWHLDYIFLDQGRADSLIDTVRNDITINALPTSFLKDYSAMPYQQYLASDMASKISVRIRNNSSAQPNIGYKYQVYDKTGSLVCPEYDGGFQNLNPFIPNNYSPSGYGYSNWPAFANPSVQCVIPNLAASADYFIKHFIYLSGSSASSDIIKGNDTVVQNLRFRNYYAFDDGSAEGGYYVNGIGATMAVKIRVNVLDTLRAVRIYFDPTGNVKTISGPNSTTKFLIKVWSQAPNGGPGSTVYMTDSLERKPIYDSTGFKAIPEFDLTRPLPMAPGNYFVGIQQKNATGTVVVGYDMNYDSHTSLYYDSGAGWTQSQIIGSLMLHPVFGNKYTPPVGINEIKPYEQNTFLVFPNPSSEKINIRSKYNQPSSYTLLNAMGQQIMQNTDEHIEREINTTNLTSGIYFLILKTNGRTVQQQKILIQH